MELIRARDLATGGQSFTVVIRRRGMDERIATFRELSAAQGWRDEQLASLDGPVSSTSFGNGRPTPASPFLQLVIAAMRGMHAGTIKQVKKKGQRYAPATLEGWNAVLVSFALNDLDPDLLFERVDDEVRIRPRRLRRLEDDEVREIARGLDLLPSLAGTPIGSITTSDLQARVFWVETVHGPHSAQELCKALVAVFRQAASLDLITTSPCEGLVSPVPSCSSPRRCSRVAG